MEAAFRVFTAAYGLPISHIQLRYVNGYAYRAPQFADLSARELPPARRCGASGDGEAVARRAAVVA